jgi:hypothetical protein
MTHDHSTLLAQLDALKSAEVGAVFAELIRAGPQALIGAEATEKIGAGRYQRSEDRGTHRNGHRSKTVSTTSGDIEVKIPKLRVGSFFPSLLEHWWWPPGYPSRAPGRCWAPRSGTVSPSSSGVGSWPASRPAGWPGCTWSSLMPMLGLKPLWPNSSPDRHGNGAGCISCPTCTARSVPSIVRP